MVEFRGVSKIYPCQPGGAVRALVDASFVVETGEIVVLCGPTGAGKSTVLRLAYGDERPSEGQVVVDGDDVGTLGRSGLARLRRRLGVVPQESRLVAARTVFENVALVLWARGAARRDARSRALAALRDAGLTARLHAFPSELAAGERQRLLVARALVSAPRLLLADEPTGTLDDPGAREIGELFRTVNARGTTVLVATRTSSLGRELRGRTLTLAAGRLSPDRSPDATA
jgi:cell division transport system ATP-binding protein